MKQTLESELIAIAHRILKFKDKESILKMHTEVSALYETLSVLKFAYENFEDDLDMIGNNSSFFNMLDTTFNNKISDSIEQDNKLYTNLEESSKGEIIKPVINSIKDMVAHMPKAPEESPTPSDLLSDIPEASQIETSFGSEKTPVFDAVSKEKAPGFVEKKSLNDRLKTTGITLGLNDKIAFTKELFGNNPEDYDRVISQLNTCDSYADATYFIDTMVKPDYNNWINKSLFETRFMDIVKRHFD